MADIPGYAVIRWQESIMYQFLGHRSGDKRPLYQIQQDARTAGITIPHRTRWVNDWSWIRQKVKEYNQSTRDRFRYREADVGQQEPRVPIAQRQKELSRVQMRRLAGRLIRQRIRFCKNIGWGGNGVVTLWKYETTRAEKLMVIKSSILRLDNNTIDSSSLLPERNSLKQLARAPHIVQLQLLQTLGSGTATQARRQLEEDPGFIILEFAKQGSLDNLMRRAGSLGIRRQRSHVPRAMAWRFFDCLVKGCMAMEEPPRYQTANKTSPDDQLPLSQLAPADQPRYLPETIQPDGSGDDIRIVHLDLDPQNVLLYGLDDPPDGLNPSHSDIPRLQITDFGLARTRDDLQRVPTTNMDRLQVYYQRRAGKDNWWLPEQWTAEWDDLGPNSDPYTEPEYGIIAGNYDSHSNVWHIGMIMRCLLFLEQPPQAPEADRVHIFEQQQQQQRPPPPPAAGAGPQGPNAAVPPSTPPIAREDEFWSCGAEILQDRAVVRRYGVRLCRLIARCLAYVPAHRPSLRQIQREINIGLAAERDGGRVDRDGVDMFLEPPGPLPAVAGGRVLDTDIWSEFP